ncbi:MAG: alpha/beta fold hydrolase [Gemmatimonadaceae bacterium]
MTNTRLNDQPAGEPATLDTPSGRLFGTLLVPQGSRPLPLVVIIAGSGPTDRDGNSILLPGANNSLKLLAEGLAVNGIASLRYDKRGVGESKGAVVSEADLRFDMYADDAAEWVRKLRSDGRFSSIAILGHSEGSLLGMLAAKQSVANSYVSIAGAGRAADKILREQLGTQLPPPLLEAANTTLDTLLTGQTTTDFPPQLAALFRPSVQPYVISWLRVDPQIEIAALEMPVLIVQGTLDGQVPTGDAQLLTNAHPGATLVVVDGMNHVLKCVPADAASQQASYSDPSLPVAGALVDAVSSFVKTISTHDH